MAQETLVVVVPPAQHGPLRERLAREPFEFRSVPHALFSVKGSDVVATLYRSGKLVVQGRAPGLFVDRFVGEGAGGAAPRIAPPARSACGAMRALEVTTVGSDETGKGDYFGPLVVVAVRLEPEQAAALVSTGVMDSKQVLDAKALQLAAAMRASGLPHAVRRLDPVDYNALHDRVGNVNELLADLHAAAIRELASPGMRVVIDRFAREELMERRLRGLGVELEQRPRAEDDPAVAAASVLARSEFLLALKELGQEIGHVLPKGAGTPVDVAAREIVRAEGTEALARVAKLHFKNTRKIGGRRG